MQQFKDIDLQYLDGSIFSNGAKFVVGKRQDETGIPRRIDTLVEISKDKHILHLGFADHLPLIRDKIAKGIWLHKRLMDVAMECWGLDIEDNVVEFVKSEIGIEEVIRLDIIKDEVPLALKKDWDYMIIGEVLEHIDNPVEFLSSIRKKYAPYVRRIVVTVPNAYDIYNIRNIRKGIECINTDHRYWFTPFTLAKVGVRSGLKIVGFTYCQNYLPDSRINRMLVKRYPMLRETVLMVFELPN